MPIYEYRCQKFKGLTDVLWRGFTPPESVGCRNCESEKTFRIISRVAFHKSFTTRLSELDSKYDKMVDDATARSGPMADPNHIMRNMPKIESGKRDEPGFKVD